MVRTDATHMQQNTSSQSGNPAAMKLKMSLLLQNMLHMQQNQVPNLLFRQ